MTLRDRCRCKARRADRQTSAQPGRAGKSVWQAVERRRCGTTLFVCSLGAHPEFLLHRSHRCPLWFSLEENHMQSTEAATLDRRFVVGPGLELCSKQ